MAQTSGNDIRSQLQQRGQNVPPPLSFNDMMKLELKKAFPAIKSVVPNHMTPERMARIALTTISRTPALAECTPASIIGAVMNCAILGLEPNLIGHAYLVPFYNSKTKTREAQFVIGYKGYIDLVRRTGDVSSIYAHEVCQKDDFDYCYGLNKDLKHKPAEGDRGPVTHYYACYHLKDGAFDFTVMTRTEVENHRDKYSKAKQFGPWVDNFDEMAKKTCIRKMIKFMPISIEVAEQLAKDEAVITPRKDNGLESTDIFDVEFSDITQPTEEAEPEPEPKKEDTEQPKDTLIYRRVSPLR